MNGVDTIDVARLLDLLEHHGRSWSSPEGEAGHLLGELPRDAELPVSRSDVTALRRIHRRRADRPGADPAVGELARRVEALDSTEVASVALSVEGKVVYLWLDARLTSLVGCFVGTDRRVDP